MMDSESSPSYPAANHVRVHPHPPHAHQQQHQQHQHHNGAMTPMAAQQPMFLPAQPLGMNGNSNVTMGGGGMNGGGMNGGGLLYNNLIPGHYRYGAKPPAPPPGPLSYSNTSSHPPQHSLQNSSQNQYSNVAPASSQGMNGSSECYLQVTEPDDEWDDVAISNDEEEDDEQYYRPFRHASGISVTNGSAVNPPANKNKTSQVDGKVSRNNARTVVVEEKTKPVDILAVLLGGPARQQQNGDDGNSGDIAVLMETAAEKSQRARSMTNALAAKQTSGDGGKAKKGETKGEVDSDLYVATANAHTEAALAYQKVYRRLLGLEISNDTNSNVRKRTVVKGVSPSPSEELAKSMLILAHTHARMAKSLGTMGAKWNMGRVDPGGRMVSKDSTTSTVGKAATNDKKAGKDEKKDDQSNKAAATKPTSNSASPANGDASKDDETSPGALQHERLRMAVRGALDTAHHEEDITNSTFLARSTVLNAANNGRQGASKAAPSKSRNRLAGLGLALGNAAGGGKKGGEGGVNPVDDLMKLEKELQCMDMALEMGNSVASLGGATTAAASFCVVPPGKSSYMTSSSMWASGILGGMGGGGNAQQQQQQQNQQHPAKQQARPGLQQGMAGVRSRANHLQSFLGGNRQQPASAQPHPPAKTAAAPSPSPRQQRGEQIAPGGAALDQSWWGGGQGSVLASSAVAAVSSNGQRSPTSGPSGPDASNDASSAARQQQTSTNAKQLMQLMDSLNRLGNENAQLMREVEDARAARAEAKAAKDLMAKFKAEYGQKFGKVKEALKRYPGPQQGGTSASGGAGDPVADSAYVKQASALEIQKRDRTIRQLSADLKRERDECKKKDGALQKYEAFYREVKARSAEKARQRQLQEKRAGQPKAKGRPQQQRP